MSEFELRLVDRLLHIWGDLREGADLRSDPIERNGVRIVRRQATERF